MIFIVNIIILYRVVKNKKILSINSYDYISLNNRKRKAFDKIIVPIVGFSFILNLLNIWIGEFLLG